MPGTEMRLNNDLVIYQIPEHYFGTRRTESLSKEGARDSRQSRKGLMFQLRKPGINFKKCTKKGQHTSALRMCLELLTRKKKGSFEISQEKGKRGR